MKIKLLVLASILTIPSFSVINIRSVLAQIQRPIGRAYSLPGSPFFSPVGRIDSDGDSIADIVLESNPSPRVEFDILTELDGQLITDRSSNLTTGFFPGAVPFFLYALDADETLRRISDEDGNFLPSTQEQEIIERFVPDTEPTTFADGDLLTELFIPSAIDTTFADSNSLETNVLLESSPGIFYSFLFEEDFISFFLPLDENADIETVLLSINDLSYILDQNLLGRGPRVPGASFDIRFISLFSGQPTIISSSQSINDISSDQNSLGREAIFSGARANTNIGSLSSERSTIISSSQSTNDMSYDQNLLGREARFSGARANTNIGSLSSNRSIPESNNLISLLGLGLVGIASLIKDRVRKF